jgi:hypothetical protein
MSRFFAALCSSGVNSARAGGFRRAASGARTEGVASETCRAAPGLLPWAPREFMARTRSSAPGGGMKEGISEKSRLRVARVRSAASVRGVSSMWCAILVVDGDG